MAKKKEKVIWLAFCRDCDISVHSVKEWNKKHANHWKPAYMYPGHPLYSGKVTKT